MADKLSASSSIDKTEDLRRWVRDADFHPIPCEGKAPKFDGWQNTGSASNAVIKYWRNGKFSRMTNTGLLAKTTPGFDIDILNRAAVKAAIALVRKRYASKGRILTRIGLPPKALIPFRTEKPFTKITIELMPPGATKNTKAQVLEFLGDGQQFIAFGIHPDTGRAYTWDKAGAPGDVRRDQLPLITAKEASLLVDEVAKLLVDRFGYTFKSKSTASEAAAKTRTVRQALNVYQAFALPDIDDVASAVRAIPNNDEHHDVWKAMVLRIFASTGGSDAGLVISDEYSKRSKLKYNFYRTRAAWNGIRRSPPSRTGPGALFAIAREHGWEERLEIVKPAKKTLRIKGTVTLEQAEAKTREVICSFLCDTVDRGMINIWVAFYCEEKYGLKLWGRDGPPGVIALDVDMGVGKTSIAIEQIAAWLKLHQDELVIYAVPTHTLAEQIRQDFIAAGVTDVEIWKGRDHSDNPDDPDDTMCLNRKATNNSVTLGLKVYETCCKNGKLECIFFKTCRHIAQREKTPQVWIVTHEMLFTAEETFKGARFVVIDEDASRKGLRGIENAKSWIIPLKNLEADIPDLVELEIYRRKLVKALRRHADDARHVERDLLWDEIESDDVGEALHLEWKVRDIYVKELGVKPGSLGGNGKTLSNAQLTRAIKLCNQMIKIWGELHEVVDGSNKIEKSGRLMLATNDNDERCITWRGVERIKKQFRIPTLLMDGTLAAKEVLRINHPQAVIAARVRVEMPESVRVTQVLHAPTSTTKLDDPDQLAELLRAVQLEYLKLDRPSDTVMITQQNAETWFRRAGLPAGMKTEHFNNLVGLNRHEKVRLLALIGRTQPTEATILTEAEALCGRYIEPVVPGEHGATNKWRYHKVKRAIQLRDGRMVMVDNYAHPDPFAEAVRWQICEAQLLQALARSRWVRRTSDSPLHIVTWANNALPLTVYEVVGWKSPSGLIKTAMNGVMLTSPSDIAQLWCPAIWSNRRAVRRDVEKGVQKLPGFTRVTYQRKGPKLKRQKAWFDTRLIDPASWDGWDQLGGLAFFEIDPKKQA